ncbi:3-hydroxyacyl-ACP dehydratase FabZ [Streptococcus macacae]|uniref:Beta-hydroxyacyl-(Acyl-carrier-protein) dehydratase FabZ n=1 Tax=Streptococcus macacae NCTC 11558 TaxID=764298 RepID=G5JUF0_9STRE|nr:3-hydroxyacyl-ACP dehydratase FabZ [Streptococcus macacae]EHJ53040.1 putative beta-hydroxyacyl-(acyl-carrier-protein) dehydratase FabZ [Streptococcus macacae NCTC 11558]SUN78592.1 (3R)-hydroxymyristoyl-ACP dehydratase [Streptococcus macacae NCTC 11558]
MNFQEVSSVLPQKFPLQMVDKVLELLPEKKIISIKNITGNEMVFLGHFPNQAIFPGVYITEALAQSAILLFKKKEQEDKLFLLYSTKMTFKSVVVPGDQLKMIVESKKVTALGVIVEAVAYVEDRIVAKGELIFSIKESLNA